MEAVRASRLFKTSLAIVLAGLGLALGPLYIPVGPTKAYPAQHMINVIAGVYLGPLWAAILAAVIGTLRIALGVGTVFAYPGGIPGAFLVGLGALLLSRAGRDPRPAGLLEPLGTLGVGFTLSYLIVAPLVGAAWESAGAIAAVWAASTGIGTLLGLTILGVLWRAGFKVQRVDLW